MFDNGISLFHCGESTLMVRRVKQGQVFIKFISHSKNQSQSLKLTDPKKDVDIFLGYVVK